MLKEIHRRHGWVDVTRLPQFHEGERLFSNHIVYKCEDGRIPRCSRIARQFQTLICFPAVKHGFIFIKIRMLNTEVSDWMSSMSESHCRYLFHKEMNIWDSSNWLEHDNFKPYLKSDIFKSLSCLNNGSFFWGDHRDFWKRESRPNYNGTNIDSQLVNFLSVSTSIV